MQWLSMDKAIDKIVEFMAPGEKGNIRDIISTGLLFVVFVYIS